MDAEHETQRLEERRKPRRVKVTSVRMASTVEELACEGVEECLGVRWGGVLGYVREGLGLRLGVRVKG